MKIAGDEKSGFFNLLRVLGLIALSAYFFRSGKLRGGKSRP